MAILVTMPVCHGIDMGKHNMQSKKLQSKKLNSVKNSLNGLGTQSTEIHHHHLSIRNCLPDTNIIDQTIKKGGHS